MERDRMCSYERWSTYDTLAAVALACAWQTAGWQWHAVQCAHGLLFSPHVTSDECRCVVGSQTAGNTIVLLQHAHLHGTMRAKCACGGHFVLRCEER